MDVKNLSIKTKLVISILIPIMILLFSLMISLWDDYTDIQATVKASHDIELTKAAGRLFDALQEERALALLTLVKENLVSTKDITQSRILTDQALRNLKDLSEKYQFADSTYNQQFRNFHLKFEGLTEKRRTFDDNTSNTIENARSTYNELSNDVVSHIMLVMESESVASFVKTLVSYAALMHDYNTLVKIRGIVFKALSQNQMTQNEFEYFLRLLGQKEAYELLYTDTFMSQQESYYLDFIKTQQFGEFTKTIDIVLKKGVEGHFDLDSAKWWDSVTQKISKLKEAGQKLLDDEKVKIDSKASFKIRTLFTQLTIAVGLILLSLIFALMNIRSLSTQLKDGVKNLSSAGQEISNSIVDASSSTAETAAAVTETTTTVEELKQTAQVSAEKAKNVSDLSDETLQILKESEQSLNSTIDGMNNIKEGINTISETIIKLSEHGQTIGEIIGTVNDLAEQSHLLAINAAIEAAKAEHKGFAVVAQEVRLLAEQSKQATVQVRNILNDIQNATSAAVMATDQGSKAVSIGVEQSQKTTKAIQTMSQKINTLNQAAYQIAISSQQQLIGVGQVTLAMSNIKEASHKQVENMHQIEFGINGLNNVGQSLKMIVR